MLRTVAKCAVEMKDGKWLGHVADRLKELLSHDGGWRQAKLSVCLQGTGPGSP
jgi:hypothetical protein